MNLQVFYIMVTEGEGLKLKEGMIFTIEPMLNAGTNED